MIREHQRKRTARSNRAFHENLSVIRFGNRQSDSRADDTAAFRCDDLRDDGRNETPVLIITGSLLISSRLRAKDEIVLDTPETLCSALECAFHNDCRSCRKLGALAFLLLAYLSSERIINSSQKEPSFGLNFEKILWKMYRNSIIKITETGKQVKTTCLQCLHMNEQLYFAR